MLNTQLPGHLADLTALGGGHKRDPDALGAGAAGASDPVNICLAVGRWVEVDHVRDSAHVDSAGGDVGGDERVDAPDSNAASAVSRWRCDLLPCIARASIP